MCVTGRVSHHVAMRMEVVGFRLAVWHVADNMWIAAWAAVRLTYMWIVVWAAVWLTYTCG